VSSTYEEGLLNCLRSRTTGGSTPRLGVQPHSARDHARVCETRGLLALRREEREGSEEVGVLPKGEQVTVLQVGLSQSLRIGVTVVGWISTRTAAGEPLLQRSLFSPRRPVAVGSPSRRPSLDAGEDCKVVSLVTVRAGAALDSEVVGVLYIGTIVKVLSVSTTLDRRVQIITQLKGWVPAKMVRKCVTPLVSHSRSEESLR